MQQPEERVSILEPVIARTHTTFYNKQKPASFAESPEDYIVKPREALPRKQWEKGNMNKPEERVSILEPVIARTHTTFYNKLGQQVSKRKWISDSHPVNNDNIDDYVYESAHEASDVIPILNRPSQPPSELFARK